jgi:hypothetical protein
MTMTAETRNTRITDYPSAILSPTKTRGPAPSPSRASGVRGRN